MTATVTRLPLTPELALDECRDLAQMVDVAPAAIAERQMEQAAKRGDYQAVAAYTQAHSILTTSNGTTSNGARA